MNKPESKTAFFDTNKPENKTIKYSLFDGTEKEATIVPVDFPTDGLSQTDMSVIESLGSAVSFLSSIYATQQYSDSETLLRSLLAFEDLIENPEKKAAVANFNDLFIVKNGPFDLYGRKHVFPLSEDEISMNVPLAAYKDFLFTDKNAPATRGLYPAYMNKKLTNFLGKKRNIINSTVVNRGNGLEVILNEKRFKRTLQPVILDLLAASNVLNVNKGNKNLINYVNAKLDEIMRGTPESIENSWKAWMDNDSKIDFIMGTGIELYLDKLIGVRGSAQGVVYVVDDKFTKIKQQITDLLPKMEEIAPWKYKKTVDKSNLPRLNFVNAFNWSGFYNLFPMIVNAESLPDEKKFRDKYGSVNVVFINTIKARYGTSAEQYLSDAFFTKSELDKYMPLIPDMNLTMIALHEQGHTTGDSKIKQDPSIYFGEDFAIMEEARAELFSMWTLPILRDKGIISEDQEIAGYYNMLRSLIKAMETPPEDHNGSRNIMLHYFLKKGAVIEKDSKFFVNPEQMRRSHGDLLGIIGDIKATGDKKSLDKLKAGYMDISRQDYFKEKLAQAPLGLGLIFPLLQKYTNDKFSGELIYPQSFRHQFRALSNVV